MQRLNITLLTTTVVICLFSITSSYARSSVPRLNNTDLPIKPMPHRDPQATIEYCTGFDYQDYAQEISMHSGIPGETNPLSWGRHPILWKHMIHPEYDLDIYGEPFNPTEIFIGVPNGIDISPGDSVSLDGYEASDAFSQNGVSIDPAGNWVETIIPDATTTAIYAAMSIWRYSTPVYINYNGGNLTGSAVGVIDCVTLSASAGPPHIACDWENNGVSVGTAESCNDLVVESIKLTYFTEPTLCIGCNGPYYEDASVMDAQTFETGYHVPSFWGNPKVVIMDPPANVFIDVNAMRIASQRQGLISQC